jgi:hypothetical protein
MIRFELEMGQVWISATLALLSHLLPVVHFFYSNFFMFLTSAKISYLLVNLLKIAKLRSLFIKDHLEMISTSSSHPSSLCLLLKQWLVKEHLKLIGIAVWVIQPSVRFVAFCLNLVFLSLQITRQSYVLHVYSPRTTNLHFLLKIQFCLNLWI